MANRSLPNISGEGYCQKGGCPLRNAINEGPMLLITSPQTLCTIQVVWDPNCIPQKIVRMRSYLRGKKNTKIEYKYQLSLLAPFSMTSTITVNVLLLFLCYSAAHSLLTLSLHRQHNSLFWMQQDEHCATSSERTITSCLIHPSRTDPMPTHSLTVNNYRLCVSACAYVCVCVCVCVCVQWHDGVVGQLGIFISNGTIYQVG